MGEGGTDVAKTVDRDRTAAGVPAEHDPDVISACFDNSDSGATGSTTRWRNALSNKRNADVLISGMLVTQIFFFSFSNIGKALTYEKLQKICLWKNPIGRTDSESKKGSNWKGW